MADLEAEEIRVRFLAPLLGVEIAANEIPIDSQIALRRIRLDEVEGWGNRPWLETVLVFDGPLLPGDELLSIKCVLEITLI